MPITKIVEERVRVPAVLPSSHIAIYRHTQAEGFSGADLAALLREAGLDVLRQLKNRESSSGTDVYAEEGERRRYCEYRFEALGCQFMSVRSFISPCQDRDAVISCTSKLTVRASRIQSMGRGCSLYSLVALFELK